MIHRMMLPAVLVGMVVSASAPAQPGEPSADWRRDLIRPAHECSQMPFWFWNDELDDAEIRRQMADFREHGVYGFVIHARIGLPGEIPYMGRRWLGHVQSAVEEAARTGMLVCLYDEGMYPSGSAHGEVVRSNPAFAAQGLAVRSQDLDGPAEVPVPAPGEGKFVAAVIAKRAGDGGRLDLGGAQVVEQPGGTVKVPEGPWRMMTFTAEPSGGHIRGVHFGEDDGQPGAPPAADLLNPDAMKAFLRFCYQPYYETLQNHFGKTVFAVFTDEPSLLGRGARGGLRPWTGALADDFRKRRGYDLLPLLPALFYDCGEPTGRIREDFELTVAQRLDETYYQQLSKWCGDHGVALTGHPSGSDESRPLRLFQIPGQDLVWRWVLPNHPTALEGANSTVAKCSSSAARHDRRRRNANEIYGAYGWHLTMDEMKWLADWLTVRGVNLLYPHAFYYSIRDRRAYERPPDLGPNNAWWPHYRQFADYTARLCSLMVDGRQVCDVAVLGVGNRLPWRAARWLYRNQVDFNYLEDWRLCEQATLADGRIQIAGMRYRLLIVDQDAPLAGALAERVKAFEDAGGTVRYCRSEPAEELIAGLQRDVRLDPPSPDLRYAHVVKHGIDFYLLVNEGEGPIDGLLTCRASGKPEWFDPWSGRFRPAPIVRADRSSISLPVRLERRESLVLSIDTAEPAVVSAAAPAPSGKTQTTPVAGPWKIVDPQGKPLGEQLGDWGKLPGPADFAGTLRYRTTFDGERRAGCAYRLDLGAVGDWAVVRINGTDLGPRLWAPYAWDVTGAIRDGKNELVVEVTNSRANRYDPKRRRPSGLFGPVEIRATSPE